MYRNGKKLKTYSRRRNRNLHFNRRISRIAPEPEATVAVNNLLLKNLQRRQNASGSVCDLSAEFDRLLQEPVYNTVKFKKHISSLFLDSTNTPEKKSKRKSSSLKHTNKSSKKIAKKIKASKMIVDKRKTSSGSRLKTSCNKYLKSSLVIENEKTVESLESISLKAICDFSCSPVLGDISSSFNSAFNNQLKFVSTPIKPSSPMSHENGDFTRLFRQSLKADKLPLVSTASLNRNVGSTKWNIASTGLSRSSELGQHQQPHAYHLRSLKNCDNSRFPAPCKIAKTENNNLKNLIPETDKLADLEEEERPICLEKSIHLLHERSLDSLKISFAEDKCKSGLLSFVSTVDDAVDRIKRISLMDCSMSHEGSAVAADMSEPFGKLVSTIAVKCVDSSEIVFSKEGFFEIEVVSVSSDDSAATDKVEPQNVVRIDGAGAEGKMPDEEVFIRPSIVLKPGKAWRRSLIGCPTSKSSSGAFRKSVCIEPAISRSPLRKLYAGVDHVSTKIERSSRPSLAKCSILGKPATLMDALVECEETKLEESELTVLSKSEIRELSIKETNARNIVLNYCQQDEPIDFDSCYSSVKLKNCTKIGEGVSGEVFSLKSSRSASVIIKVVPIEGLLNINSVQQKKYEEMISEIVISSELSKLQDNEEYSTSGFVNVCAVRCVKGKYPARLMELWRKYDDEVGSENDSPEVFGDDQLYIVFELGNAGKDMEAFVFNNAQQAFYVFKQLAYSLAVAESAFEFEHRDLHWGNVLIQTTKLTTVKFCLDNQTIRVPTKGVKATIIDYTLSRMTYNSLSIFADLSKDDDLFTAHGDYQFEVYRLMQQKNENEWEHFEPYTNILWLGYTLDKMVKGLRYRSKDSRLHSNYLNKLTEMKKKLHKFSSALCLVNSDLLD